MRTQDGVQNKVLIGRRRVWGQDTRVTRFSLAGGWQQLVGFTCLLESLLSLTRPPLPSARPLIRHAHMSRLSPGSCRCWTVARLQASGWGVSARPSSAAGPRIGFHICPAANWPGFCFVLSLLPWLPARGRLGRPTSWPLLSGSWLPLPDGASRRSWLSRSVCASSCNGWMWLRSSGRHWSGPSPLSVDGRKVFSKNPRFYVCQRIWSPRPQIELLGKYLGMN